MYKSKMKYKWYIAFCTSILIFNVTICAQNVKGVTKIPVGLGWANNSINTVVFRKNSLCTFGKTQYISYYNQDGFVVLGKRKISSKKWILKTTSLKGNVGDAHNSISIIVDSEGFLHLTWNHHNNQLHYCKSIRPGSLELTAEMPMTGLLEKNVSYPEFYNLPEGDLLFLYRDGQSGQGNLVLNRYFTKQKSWQQLQSNLIDGENKRNAYWQACVDKIGAIHISWVWRESPDVSSNHDICYAKSLDGGISWQNSKAEKYQIPITEGTAEYVYRVPQKSELINQTSMTATEDGSPIIATYWKVKGDSVPQYHILYPLQGEWHEQNLGFRKTAFSLSGAGTKRIPISRPQVIAWKNNNNTQVALIYRDEENGSKISIAINRNMLNNKWDLQNITSTSVGSWEPTYDIDKWKKRKQLHLFVQRTDQLDKEGNADILPQLVYVLAIKKL